MVNEFIESHFLFEKWAIESRIKLLERFRDANILERDFINQEHTLINLFMLRRGQDPGFCSFVYQSIEGDKKVLFRTKKLILKLLSDTTDDPDELVRMLDTDVLQLDMISDKSKTRELQDNRKRTLDFYKFMKRKALENNDYDQIFAIDSLINEYKYEFTGFDIQLSYDRYKDPEFKEKYNIFMRKFSLTTIDRLSVYHDNELNYDMIQIMDFLNPFFSDLILKHITDLIGEDLPPKAYLAYNKLLRDCMSIISIEWFLQLDFISKIEILNKNYELNELLTTVDISSLIRSEKYFGMWFPTNIVLNNLGYHKEALNLSLKTIKLDIIKNKPEILIKIYDDIAYGYKQIKDFKRSINFFKRKINEIIKNKSSKWVYHISVAYKNIAELHFYLNDKKNSNIYFEKAEKFFEKLALDEKYGILHNLAMTNQRILEFGTEKQFLERMMKLPSEDPNKQAARARLMLLDNLDKEQLTILFKKDEIEGKIENAKTQSKAWNVSKAIETYTSLLTDIPEELNSYVLTILEDLGRIHFELFNFKESANNFIEIIRNNQKPPHIEIVSLSYLIAIGILTNNEVMVSDNIEKALHKINFNSQSFSSFFEQTGLLILLGSKESYEKNIESFWNQFTSRNINPYSLFGQFLMNYGYYELALEYLNIGVLHDINKKDKAKFLLKIGRIYNKVGNFTEALINLEKSKEHNSTKEQVYIELANVYAAQKKYMKSLETLKQGKTFLQETTFIEILLDKYETLVRDVLNIDEELPEKFRRILNEGERLYQNYLIMAEHDQIDAASVILQYSKFVESILDHFIANPFFQSIVLEFGWNIKKSFWPRSDQIFHSYKKSIENGNKRQLTLGQWEFLLGKFEDQRSMGKPSLMENYISNHSKYIQKEKITEACSALREIRNLGVHKDIIELSILKQKRPKIIQNMNSLINMVLMK